MKQSIKVNISDLEVKLGNEVIGEYGKLDQARIIAISKNQVSLGMQVGMIKRSDHIDLKKNDERCIQGNDRSSSLFSALKSASEPEEVADILKSLDQRDLAALLSEVNVDVMDENGDIDKIKLAVAMVDPNVKAKIMLSLLAKANPDAAKAVDVLTNFSVVEHLAKPSAAHLMTGASSSARDRIVAGIERTREFGRKASDALRRASGCGEHLDSGLGHQSDKPAQSRAIRMAEFVGSVVESVTRRIQKAITSARNENNFESKSLGEEKPFVGDNEVQNSTAEWINPGLHDEPSCTFEDLPKFEARSSVRGLLARAQALKSAQRQNPRLSTSPLNPNPGVLLKKGTGF